MPYVEMVREFYMNIFNFWRKSVTLSIVLWGVKIDLIPDLLSIIFDILKIPNPDFPSKLQMEKIGQKIFATPKGRFWAPHMIHDLLANMTNLMRFLHMIIMTNLCLINSHTYISLHHTCCMYAPVKGHYLDFCSLVIHIIHAHSQEKVTYLAYASLMVQLMHRFD